MFSRPIIPKLCWHIGLRPIVGSSPPLLVVYDMNLVMYIIQDPKYYLEKFYVLKVDKNNIRMSKFVRAKIGSFDNGKAFYEFKQHEYLPCYKEVVHVPMSVYNRITIEQVCGNNNIIIIITTLCVCCP